MVSEIFCFILPELGLFLNTLFCLTNETCCTKFFLLLLKLGKCKQFQLVCITCNHNAFQELESFSPLSFFINGHYSYFQLLLYVIVSSWLTIVCKCSGSDGYNNNIIPTTEWGSEVGIKFVQGRVRFPLLH